MSSVCADVLQVADEHELAVLSDAEFRQLVDDIVGRYVARPTSLWWWDQLKVDNRTIDYEGQDGLDVLAKEIGDRPDLLLVVTDESPSGIGAVRGTMFQLLDLVRRAPGFEFAVVPADISWIVFDTHHNALVLVKPLTREQVVGAAECRRGVLPAGIAEFRPQQGPGTTRGAGPRAGADSAG